VRLLLVDADRTLDVFDVVEITETSARVRTPFLFEIDEELVVRIEHNGVKRNARAYVRSHTGTDAKITELELEFHRW
jgi:hypothetical protein